jgi:hypothetical protein
LTSWCDTTRPSAAANRLFASFCRR